MTVLSRSSGDAEIITVQCDVCCPPGVATSKVEELRSNMWQLAEAGVGGDVCPKCVQIPRAVRRLRSERFQGRPVGRLPDLLVIGAAKAGTTSLHAHLATHPDIAMSEPKELQFFQDPDGAEWLGHYSSRFDSDAALVGESSTTYSQAPAMPGVPERMATTVPDARLIYMVRDPVDRAFASYLEERFQLCDTRPLDEAFADLDDPYNPYVAGSRYAAQLRGFYEHFPPEQVLVVPLEDLRDSPGVTMRRVFTFLGVDAGHEVDTGLRLNAAEAKFEYTRLGLRLRQSVGAPLVRRLPLRARTWARANIQRFLSRPMARPELTEELRGRLEAALAPDAEEFRRITGMGLEDWSV